MTMKWDHTDGAYVREHVTVETEESLFDKRHPDPLESGKGSPFQSIHPRVIPTTADGSPSKCSVA